MFVLFRVVFCLLCCITQAFSGFTQSKLTKEPIVKVLRVIDGDTIEVEDKDSSYRVRLYGIDAPERGQEFYKESKLLLQQLTKDSFLKLEIKGKDVYRRTLAVIIRERDCLNINYEMVNKGLAWHFIRYSSDPQLAKLELSARTKQIGIWSLYHYLAPWEYRKN